ncbi:carbohydrate-binding module family 14 protein [Sulfitobacter sp. D35]|uniref:carbohydrate-binding module family 14 protein n=1 Tax=Sulfitobacter sp. D35 TaxID=3083252 RepID=UPI00296F8329|nr:carbohydrate-binding module family 14 protein [Sulfitobacter sp. D35]MDW4496702.1 carbohydrate-binding module family 14 protein [Sulfitobacter sp. D35]
MTMRTLAVSLALSLAPLVAQAECFGHERQVMNCADGTVYDANTGTCVDVNT